jgi:arylsulfatase A-like enzyme
VQNRLPRRLLAGPLLAAFPGVYRSAEEITDAATSWLAGRPAGQPYFLFLNYMDAHTPFVRRPGFSGRWPGRSPRLPGYGLPRTQLVMARHRTLTDEEAAHLRALYDDALSYLDHHLGRLFQALDAQPDRDRTWVVVTADHGESLGEHHQLGHDCALYEAVLRVPLLIRYPHAAPEAARHGGVDERVVQTTDLAPAILAAAGGPAPRDSPSRHGIRVASVDCFCWRHHPQFHGPAAQAVVIGPLKHLQEQGRPPALFDLAADPLEQRDLLAARPDDMLRLAAELQQWRSGLAPPPPATATADPAREVALRARGDVR